MQKAKYLFLTLLASLSLLIPFAAQSQVVSGAKRLDLGATPLTGSTGGGSGTGWTYDAGEDAWIFTPPSGASDTRILSDGISLQDAAGTDIMAMDATLGATTHVAGRLAADAIEVRGIDSLSATGTITATNVKCATSGGAVVGTLNADAGNVGRFVYVTRDGANTCTIGVTSGQTLDGVTDGTTTVPSAGWKTFIQTTPTAWVTAGSYPVTGTLSGLTATKLPVATSATAVGDSAITHVAATGDTLMQGSAPKLRMDLGGVISQVYPDAGNLLVIDYPGYLVLKAAGTQMGFFISSSGWNGDVNGNSVAAASQIAGFSSKALVDATATAFMRAYMDPGAHSGGTVEYSIYATDGTDHQIRSGSIPWAARDVAGVSSCVFGTASDAYSGSAGTLTATWDCVDGTSGVLLRVTADTSLASTTSFVIKSRLNITGRAGGGAIPQ